MPKILDDMVAKLKAQGHDEQSAHAIATAALQKQGKLKRGSRKLTTKVRKAGRKSQ